MADYSKNSAMNRVFGRALRLFKYYFFPKKTTCKLFCNKYSADYSDYSFFFSKKKHPVYSVYSKKGTSHPRSMSTRLIMRYSTIYRIFTDFKSAIKFFPIIDFFKFKKKIAGPIMAGPVFNQSMAQP